MQVRDANIWKSGKPSVRDAGVWKPVQKGWVRDAGVWKPFYSAAEPFSLSGSWESGLDGWTLNGGISRSNSSGLARTGSFYLVSVSSTAETATYTIPKDQAAGLSIRARVWRKRQISSGNSNVSITVEEVGGASQTAGGLYSSTTYNQISPVITAIGIGDVIVTITLSTNTGPTVVDDWSIEGTVS